ncbi:protein translocase subunit SecD [bacterium]|nr:MAG: protein translocase subunit SecD [bacterium]
MEKNLTWKFVLIGVLVVVSVWTLYPASQTLKPGIDLAGGTSLIYEIDTQGLTETEKKDLSQRMITVLRRRIDPGNIQNLIWRPQGNTRFEIQMPLSSAETRLKRQNFEKTLDKLLSENMSPAIIMRSLQKPAEQRSKDFAEFAKGSSEKLTILNNLADTYDQRIALQKQRDELYDQLQTPEGLIKLAGFELNKVKMHLGEWVKLDQEQLAKALKDFPGSEGNEDLLTRYVKMYSDWAKVAEQLTDPESGKNVQYKNAKKALGRFNLTPEQINSVLEMSPKSPQRAKAVKELKAEFPDRANMIDAVITAYDIYRPMRGSLDDPSDLQRMLKGSGILEFRILPMATHQDADSDLMAGYLEAVKSKGPKYASDDKYVWCEIENAAEWKRKDVFIAPFGNKVYVLASNKQDETMLHGTDKKSWSLTKAYPQTDDQGRRAIGFILDEKGGRLFFNVTGKNLQRPLCILLDSVAISAPNIQARISSQGVITGSFSQTEIEDMVNKLNAGSLPARLIEQPIAIKTIGPSLGADNRDKGIRSGIIGLAGVISCMAIYYTLGGAIADVALLMNLLFTLAIMALLKATFTLPGIAGTILTIGMSVDANVLIFERIREEQQKGCSLRVAIKNGYEKAFSAIFDSNITTIITAAILYWVASEEIKGFALVLMLGLASSLFTALTVTRAIFNFLLNKKLIKDHLVMLHLIRRPHINWMGFRPIFFTISGILTVGGIFIFFARDDSKNSKYDIEFTGGTSVQINLKDTAHLTRQNVEDKIHRVGTDWANSALTSASVYSVGTSGKQYEITTTETNKTKTIITFPQMRTVDDILSAIKKAQEQKGAQLNKLAVTPDAKNPAAFTIATSQLNTLLVADVLKTAFPDVNFPEPKVDEVVNNAVMTAFADELQIEQNLLPKIISQEKVTEAMVDAYPELADFIGGIRIKCEIERAATGDDLDRRIKDLRFKPDMRNLTWYPYKVLDSDLAAIEPNQPVKSFVYISSHPEAGFRQLTDDELRQFVDNESTKVLAAAKLESSLPRVTQIDPSVGEEAKNQAMVAIVLSLIAMLIYIWVRFGDFRFGFGAIITLFHDTCVTVGVVVACTYIATTTIGQALLIGDFKIDLTMIAAFLTLLGYSINDTIVIYDRIRENRHKGTLTPQIINDSINETLSRTLLTGFTTLLVLFVMYVFGGTGLRGFNFAMLFGIVEGTYSSIAISAPVLLLSTKIRKAELKQKQVPLPAADKAK